MKKQDFIKEAAIKAGLTQDATSTLLSSMIEIITDELKKGNEVAITGFWTFKTTKRAARDWINPRTKEAIKIPATTSPSFKTGKTFKDAFKA